MAPEKGTGPNPDEITRYITTTYPDTGAAQPRRRRSSLSRYCRWMAASEIEGVLAAIDEFGSCLAARDLEGTLALLADDPDVTVIPSEGVDAHRGRAAVESFFGRIYAGPRRYSWRWRDRWVSAEGAWASFVALGDEFVDVAGAERRVIPYCLTGTLVRRDGSWRFLLLHGSEESSSAEQVFE